MANVKSEEKRAYRKPEVLYFGPDMMRIGEELKVRCSGEGARELERKHFVLMEKYKDFGVFVAETGYRKCFSWWDVARIKSLTGSVDNDFSVHS